MRYLRKIAIFNHDFPNDSLPGPGQFEILVPAGRNLFEYVRQRIEEAELRFEDRGLDEEHDSWDFCVTGPKPGWLECKLQSFGCGIIFVDYRMSLMEFLRISFDRAWHPSLSERFSALISSDPRFRDLVWSSDREIGKDMEQVIARVRRK